MLIGCLAYLEEDIRVEPRQAQHSQGRLHGGLSRLIFDRTLDGQLDFHKPIKLVYKRFTIGLQGFILKGENMGVSI